MRITIRSRKFVRFSQKRTRFYTKYATVILETLRNPLFQKFLDWMLKRESIEESMIANVQVRMFPFRKKNGKGLAGRCNSRGEILIYPKRLGFCRKLIRKCGKENVYFYIKSRAKAALIHELLHLKYLDNEDKVRELTRKYFNIFIQHQNTQNSNAYNVLKMLFTQ